LAELVDRVDGQLFVRFAEVAGGVAEGVVGGVARERVGVGYFVENGLGKEDFEVVVVYGVDYKVQFVDC
jgi:hypothetical protein